MKNIRKIRKGEELPGWFDARRWKDAHTGEYLDDIEDYLVIEIEGKIVASAQITFSKHTNCYHLASLWVDESRRGGKLGQELIEKLLSDSKADIVYMDTSKKELISYYAKCGFKVIHDDLNKFKEELLLRHPQKDTEKQIFMMCNLSAIKKTQLNY